MKKMTKYLPITIKKPIERVCKKALYFGFKHYCPVCKSFTRVFFTYGLKKRKNAQCPVCGLLERHRFVMLFLKGQTNLFDNTAKSMLHIAPEPEFEQIFKRIKNLDYLSADLYDPKAMVKMDITDIQYSDESFDVIYCSHVLEHVLDDKKAISEFFRVLKKGGQAVILVPITAEKTFEDPSVTDPAERKRLFGQHDHVRQYGPDFAERLESTGFSVQKVLCTDFLSNKNIALYGLNYISDIEVSIFVCRKG